MSSRGLPALPGIALLLALLAVLFLLGSEHVAIPWAVVGPSMAPGLKDGDRVVVDVWTYRHRSPRPGEIVLLRGPAPGSATLIKRVARPPHAGARVPRPGIWPGAAPPPGLWVLGDNPGRSVDSRDFGAVPRNRVRGRVVLRYWPLSRAGGVPEARPEEPGGLRLPDR